ncbi:MAG: hypothetical protein AAB619_03675 [Patescibacteria group bacterium]
MSKTEISGLEKRLDTIESTMVTKDEFHKEIGQVRDQMVTKDEFHTSMNAVADRMNEMTTRMDEVVTILKRLDEKRIFTIEWVRRIETDVERMKKHLHLA